MDSIQPRLIPQIPSGIEKISAMEFLDAPFPLEDLNHLRGFAPGYSTLTPNRMRYHSRKKRALHCGARELGGNVRRSGNSPPTDEAAANPLSPPDSIRCSTEDFQSDAYRCFAWAIWNSELISCARYSPHAGKAAAEPCSPGGD
jgi:hypothetical protein